MISRAAKVFLDSLEFMGYRLEGKLKRITFFSLGLFFHQLDIKINIEKKDDPPKCLKCKISAFRSQSASSPRSHLF